MNFRRWSRFSILSFYTCVTLVCLLLAGFTYKVEKARRQRATIDELQSVGVFVWYAHETSPEGDYVEDGAIVPEFLVEILGRDFFYEVVYLELGYHDSDGTYAIVRQEDLMKVLRFPSLKSLIISSVGDDLDVSVLADLKNLKSLTLGSPVDVSSLEESRPDMSIEISWYVNG